MPWNDGYERRMLLSLLIAGFIELRGSRRNDVVV